MRKKGEGHEQAERAQLHGAVGIVACVLLIVAFPLSYSFIRHVVLRLRNASKTPPRSLSLKERVALYLNYELSSKCDDLVRRSGMVVTAL